MEGNRGQVHFEQGQVLHDEGIHPCAVEFPHEGFGSLQFGIPKNGIECYINACAVTMRKVTETIDVFHRVTGGCTGTKVRAANVDRISTVANGFDAAISVAGRGKEFNGEHGGLGYGVMGRWDYEVIGL
ncbi:hypothetical protein EVA_01516 [gut metagenome]|uniref:Uncharacterized protein n=1 Tax=gut metagenome TaxID=749906 RepID=J9GR18_9ZZZZ